MGENDLKRYTVILDEGSGVLFQPVDATKTYILSAKHIFYEKIQSDQGPNEYKLKDRVSYFFSDDQNIPNDIEIKKDENYFEHSNERIDAAILVLNRNLGFNEIYVEDEITNVSDYNLTGYPEGKRSADDKYDKQPISDLISIDKLITLRLATSHLSHSEITGFSGGGIIKLNGDSLVLSGVQSKTPTGDCNGEIQVTPIKKFIEIIEQNELSELIPYYLSDKQSLLGSIFKFDYTSPGNRLKFRAAIIAQAEQIKIQLKDIYNKKKLTDLVNNPACLNSKKLWESFLEYAIIISLIEDEEFTEELFNKINKKRKFIYSDLSGNIYEQYQEILLMASENIDDNCQVLVATASDVMTPKTRRMSTSKVLKDISSVTNFDNYIHRVSTLNKIKEIIHLKAVELDCLNENEGLIDEFNIGQLDEILEQIKILVNEFFN